MLALIDLALLANRPTVGTDQLGQTGVPSRPNTSTAHAHSASRLLLLLRCCMRPAGRTAASRLLLLRVLQLLLRVLLRQQRQLTDELSLLADELSLLTNLLNLLTIERNVQAG